MDKQLLCFDDVMLVPQFSRVTSRKDVTLYTYLGRHEDNLLRLELPILSSNMKTVTESAMCNNIGAVGSLGVLHRFMDIESNVKEYKNCSYPTVVSVGVGPQEKKRFIELYKAGARLFCIDVAHAAGPHVVDMVKFTNSYSGLFLMVGAFGSLEEIQKFDDLTDCVVDVFLIGIGIGSACSTSIKTGHGVPQFDLIREVSQHYPVISNGGCKNSGDICKALAAGAQAVMLGYMLAGTSEAPGELINGTHKKYEGSASGHDGERYRTSEGVKGLVPYKGPVKDVLLDIEGALRSALSYSDAFTIDEFQKNAKFVRVTNAKALEASTRLEVILP